MFVLADALASTSLSDVLGWIAGIGATLLTAIIIAAFAFAWRADKRLGVIVSVLRGLREDMHDHEDRIRTLEGKPRKRDVMLRS